MTIVLEVPKIWGCKLAIALCGWYLVLVSKVFTEIDFQNLFNLKGGLEKSMGFIKSLSQLTSYSASTTKSFSSSCFYWQKCKSCVARDLTLSKLCHPPIHHQQQPLIDNPSTFRKSTMHYASELQQEIGLTLNWLPTLAFFEIGLTLAKLSFHQREGDLGYLRQWTIQVCYIGYTKN